MMKPLTAAAAILLATGAVFAQATPPSPAPATPATPPATPGMAAPGAAAPGMAAPGMAGPTVTTPGMAPTSAPAADAIMAATALPDITKAASALDVTKEYFAVVKGGAPRHATGVFLDFEALALRTFGDDYKSANVLDQAEIREILRLFTYANYLAPQISGVMTQLTYDNFVEVPSATAGAQDVELEVSGGPVPRTKQRFTLVKAGATWKVADIWQNTTPLSQGIGTIWLQNKAKMSAVNFARSLIFQQTVQFGVQVFQQQQQAMQQQQQMQGPAGPAGPVAPPAPAPGAPSAPTPPPLPTP